MSLKIRRNKFGRGVYTARVYREGDVVEQSDVVLVPRREIGARDRLSHYVFEWDEAHYALALGYGSLFNHDPSPNVYFRLDKRRRKIVFRAQEDLRAGEQLFVDYGYDPALYPMKNA